MTTKNIIGIETKRRFKVVDTIDDLETLANQEIITISTKKLNTNKISTEKPKIKLMRIKDMLVEIKDSKELLELMRIYDYGNWKNVGNKGNYEKEDKTNYEYPLLTNVGILNEKLNEFTVISHLQHTISKTPFDNHIYTIVSLKKFCYYQNITFEKINEINYYYNNLNHKNDN